jgi:hypothetical protein
MTGRWINPVDLVARHPDDWSYGIHLNEPADARRALFITAQSTRYHHRSTRWEPFRPLAVG